MRPHALRSELTRVGLPAVRTIQTLARLFLFWEMARNGVSLQRAAMEAAGCELPSMDRSAKRVFGVVPTELRQWSADDIGRGIGAACRSPQPVRLLGAVG